MKNFFKKLFGANNSNAKIEIVKSEESIYTAEKFRSAIIRQDIDFIIAYVQAGGDVNVVLTNEYKESVDIHFECSIIEHSLPLDYVHNSKIEAYLRAHGAIKYKEFSECRRQERLEKEKKLQEKWEQERKLKQAQKDEYIAKRLAEVEA